MNKNNVYYIKNNKYYNLNNKLLKNKDLIYKIKKFNIPKIWKDIFILPNHKKINVIGRDKNDKVQYIYNKEYRKNQDNKKYNNLIDFIKILPKIRRSINKNIKKIIIVKNV